MPNRSLTQCALGVLAALAALPCAAGEGDDAPGRPAPDVSPMFGETPAPGVPSLQMSTDFAVPGLAFGAYQPMGQVQSRGVRIDPLTVRASLQTGIGYDDNVALTEVNRTSSLFFTLSPSVAVGIEGATQRYYVVYRGNYGRYASSSADNYDDHNIGLTAASEPTERLRTLFRYDYMRGHEGRGATTTGLAAPEQWTEHAARGSVSYGAAGAQGLLDAEIGYSDRSYDTNRAVSAVRDFDRLDISGTFSYRVTPKTRAIVQVARADVNHDSDASLDSTEMRYLAGVTWAGTAKTQGTLRVGYMTRDVAQSGRPDFSGGTYEAAVTWSPLSYSVGDFSARRVFSEPSELGSSYIVNDVATVSWNHAWSDRVRSTATYLAGRQDHQGISRTDNYYSFGLRTSYAIRRAVRVGAELRRDARDSSVPSQEFTRNVTLITLETAL